MKTKSLFFFCFLFFSPIQSAGQVYGYAIIKVIDSQGRTDQVTIGDAQGATIFVNPALGESNIYGIPKDTLEIRTIQRPNMPCMYDYAQFIDLKIDYRPVCATLPMYSNFSFEVYAQDYPVSVILQEEENLFCGADHYYILDTVSCNQIDSDYNPIPGDTLFTLDGFKPNRFVIYPEVIVSTEEKESNKEILISPNPTQSEITITSTHGNLLMKKSTIFNLQGKLIHTYFPESAFKSYSCSINNKGVFLIIIETEKEIITKKVIVY